MMDTDKSVYLLVGDEEFLKEEWLKGAKRKIFKEKGASATDFNVFFANEMGPSDVVAIARTRPFLGDKRLIVIKDIDLLNSSLHKEQLLNYVRSPSSYTVLVLEADIKEKDFLTNRFLSDIASSCRVIIFKKLYDAHLYSWISKQAALRKKGIEPKACEVLRQLKGNNLKVIDEELEKLSLYVDQRPSITAADVGQLVGKGIEGSIYDIVEALSQNDTKKVLALSIDFDNKDLGNSAGLLSWNLRLLLRVKGCLGLGWSLKKIEENLRLKKFQLDRAVLQAKRLKSDWLRSAISELTAFDLKVKTSGLFDPFLDWQMLLIKLLGLNRPY